ncbi:MAG: HD-GYP domain-containing protein, partial [Solirubrobacteraceae bacterium]
EDIPLAGRLVHVADVFDVLVNERPYKESWSIEDAAEEIRRGAGTQFDPEVVEAFVDLGARAWQAAPGVYGG